MSYLSNYAHDVFVSYAHVDNTPERDGEAGWVTSFSKQLSVRLLKRLGREVSVWQDPRLDRTEVFDASIEEAVRRSALFIALVSNGYLQSKYCVQEQKWFASAGGLRVGNHRRVVPVLLYNIDHTRWPEICQGQSGFDFYDAEGPDLGRPLEPDEDPFEEKQWRMVDEVARLLDAIAEQQAAEAPPAAPPPADSFRVFLAHSDTLARDRNYLRRELADAGKDVMRRIPPPMAPQEHDEAVRAAVLEADLTVHLLDSDPGNALDEDKPETAIAVAQTRIALETETPQVVLFPESFNDEDVIEPSYAAFLKELGERPREEGSFEIIRAGSRSELLDALLTKRDDLVAARRPPPATDLKKNATAFIDLHVSDIIHVSGLLGFLAEKHVIPLTVPSVDLSPHEGLAVFEENLQKAGLFIVVFGSVARGWVEHRLQEAFKLLLSSRKRTPIAVYVAPPGKDPRAMNFTLCDVLDNSGRFDPATIEPLLAKAGWA